MRVTLPTLPDPIAELWPLLLRLAEERQDRWSIVGAQMVMLHASDHGVRRPLITEDVDVVDWSTQLRGRDRTHLRAGGGLIDEATWRAVASSVRISDARAALEILTRQTR